MVCRSLMLGGLACLLLASSTGLEADTDRLMGSCIPLFSAPPGWTPQAVGVRFPACQCSELVCKLGVPALQSLARRSCMCTQGCAPAGAHTLDSLLTQFDNWLAAGVSLATGPGHA